MEAAKTRLEELGKGTLPNCIKVISKNLTASTNTDIAKLAQSGAGSWTVVHALEQSSGRGRHGNKWISQKGDLFLSILLRPATATKCWGELSFVSAVAVATTLESYVSEEKVEVKWPNDILLDEQKVSGILLERHDDNKFGSAIIIGIGINILNKPAVNKYPVTCLTDYADSVVSVDDVLKILLSSMLHWYELWEVQGFAEIRREWMRRAYKLGGLVKIPGEGGQIENLEFRGIDIDGAMLLKGTNGQVTKVRTGTVNFL